MQLLSYLSHVYNNKKQHSVYAFLSISKLELHLAELFSVGASHIIVKGCLTSAVLYHKEEYC